MFGLSLVAASAILRGEAVSVRTLLPQMWDLRYLTVPPNPSFTMAQASSYDRHSDPGPNSDPFANGDAGQFIRQERNNGRIEDVMADLKGPGAVVRLWSANPKGTVRFYFDGETEPRIEAPLADLMNGKIAPFTAPFGYSAAMGTDVYFPFPYANSLKITVEGSNNLYYHVGYRTYSPGTRIQTYSADAVREAADAIKLAANHLNHLSPVVGNFVGSQIALTSNLQPRQTQTFLNLNKGGTVMELRAHIPFPLIQTFRAMDWSDAFQPHNVLRNLLLTVEADGEKTIEAPLGDFFATAPGINPIRTMPFEVRADGTFICRLPMPFHKNIRVMVTNNGPVPVEVSIDSEVDRKRPPANAYHLFAQWTADYGQTRPIRDMHFLDVKGEGYWIGSNLHIANPVYAWWGEGDEKVYVDGEKFPSTFGTGTEDYYGYAWSSNLLFAKPYHAQNRADGPSNLGHSNVHRWQLFDPIPYTESLRFDMEMWHWEDVKAEYARTAYWYAKPGGTGPVAVDAALLAPPEIKGPKPVDGAIEGEKLEVVQQIGGTIEHQGGFANLSSGEQLWWHDMNTGDKLVLKVPVKEAGRYEVAGNFCHARDYGIHKITLAGHVLSPIDFYNPDLKWDKTSLGTFDLPAGEVTMVIECAGHADAAEPRQMFGLDYLLLERK